MSVKSLPAHWASPHGLTEASKRASEADAKFWATASRSARRARSEAAYAAALAKVQGEGAAAGAFQPAQPAGFTSSETSPTNRLQDLKEQALQAISGEAVVVDPVKSRLARMAKMTRQALRSHKSAKPDWPVAFYTLTYRPGVKPSARHVSAFIDRARLWLLRRWKCKDFRFAWVAELQGERAKAGDEGALHYHVAIWMPPGLMMRGRMRAAKSGGQCSDAVVLPKADQRGWWPHGRTNRDWVRKSVNAYMSAYMSKGDEGKFPKGVRIHAAGGFKAPERLVRTHFGLPKWIREQTTPADRACRAKGGGWLVRSTGERLASPWVCLGVFNGRPLIVLRTPANDAAVLGYLDASYQLGRRYAEAERIARGLR